MFAGKVVTMGVLIIDGVADMMSECVTVNGKS